MVISFKQLKYFDAVARLGHFGRAAASCSVTQPALSMQIRELETALDLTLLERTPSGARLTQDGQEVAKRTRKILLEIEELGALGQSRQGVLVGPMRVGMIPTVAPYLLPPVFHAQRKAYPELELSIRETLTDTLLDALTRGEIDAAVLALPVDQADLQSLALFEDKFVLAAPLEGFGQDALLSASDLLAQTRVLLLEEGHCFRDQALEVCRSAGGDTEAFGATSLATVLRMVASGMGVTLLPEIALEAESAIQGLRVLKFKEPVPSRTIGLVWRKTSPRGADFEAFGALIKAAVDGHGGG